MVRVPDDVVGIFYATQVWCVGIDQFVYNFLIPPPLIFYARAAADVLKSYSWWGACLYYLLRFRYLGCHEGKFNGWA